MICALDKAKHVHERNPSSRQSVCYTRTMIARVQSQKKRPGRDFQGAWPQDELIGGKPPVVK
jgi:hypothetical protein